MEAILLKITEKYWLKYRSIPFVVIVAAAFCVPFIPKTGEESFLQVVIAAAIGIAVNLFYLFCCISANKLPRAKKGKTAVLFVVDAESEQLYKDVKNKLINSFSELINSDTSIQFEALYVRKEQIKNYSFLNTEESISLLNKTGAVFLTDIKYRVDNVTHAENYEMKINYGVLHPAFAEMANQVLQQDMNAMQKGLRKRRFNNAQLLDHFAYTSKALTVICQYLIGFVMLLSGQFAFSYKLLHLALQGASEERAAPDEIIYRLIQNRLAETCFAIASQDTSLFEDTKDTSFVVDMNEKLEEANSIKLQDPRYYLGKAYYAIVIDRDVKKANEYINVSKKIDGQKTWKYSDAFVAAYSEKPTMTVYRKYVQAFKVDYNIVRIIDFIEYIKAEEPERKGLYLALGLCYEKVGDYALAKQNYEQYISYGIDEQTKDFLAGRIDAFPAA